MCFLFRISVFCHLDEGKITLEIPQSLFPIFVELRVRFLVPRNDKLAGWSLFQNLKIRFNPRFAKGNPSHPRA